MLVDGVHPVDGLGLFHWFNIQVHYHRLVVAAHQNTFQCLIRAGVDLLMWDVGGDEDEVSRLGFGDKFQVLTPPHAGLPPDHIDHAFQRAMMVGTGFGVGMDADRASPDLLRPDAGGIDRGGAVHARGLRGIGIELVALDHANAVVPPIDRAWCWRFVMMIVAHRPASFG
jgi:hypothetical protein